jgi:xylulokinase
MRYLLGVDIGTSGAKALLCDTGGRLVATATADYPLSTPKPLWSEQQPEDWWRGACRAIQAVLQEAGIEGASVAGIGLTGQMHGAVFLDAEKRVIRPSLLWNDQRTAAECDEITARVGASTLIEITGNPALTGFQAPKILWVRNHEPEQFARVAQVLLPKDYIRFLLTGVAATDASDAAGTLLLDLRRRDWSDTLLTALEIPREWLPRVMEGPEVTGGLLPDVAAMLGLPAGTPVIAGGGDNAAAAVGTGIVRSGVISSSIGTSGVLFAHTDTIAIDPQGRLHTFCHAVPNQYHLMAVTLAAGGSFQWFRNLLRQVHPDLGYDTLITLAREAPVGAEGLLFLPYLSGERTPHLDPLARGAFVGLTTRHTLAHMARAVLEGVIFSLRDGLELMKTLGVPLEEVRTTGGGGRSSLWQQVQADIYGMEIATLTVEEGPAYGAALLAGVGAGVFGDVGDAVTRCVAVKDVTHPTPAHTDRYEAYYSIYRTLYGAMQPHFHALSHLALQGI